jgi:hypothetical protein
MQDESRDAGLGKVTTTGAKLIGGGRATALDPHPPDGVRLSGCWFAKSGRGEARERVCGQVWSWGGREGDLMV